MCEEVAVKEFVLSCCLEGTYVRRMGQLFSFKTEQDPECLRVLATAATGCL